MRRESNAYLVEDVGTVEGLGHRDGVRDVQLRLDVLHNRLH